MRHWEATQPLTAIHPASPEKSIYRLAVVSTPRPPVLHDSVNGSSSVFGIDYLLTCSISPRTIPSTIRHACSETNYLPTHSGSP